MTILDWRATKKGDRFYRVLGKGWYVRTREGLVGPYPYKGLAERHLELVKQVFKDRRPSGSPGLNGMSAALS